MKNAQFGKTHSFRASCNQSKRNPFHVFSQTSSHASQKQTRHVSSNLLIPSLRLKFPGSNELSVLKGCNTTAPILFPNFMRLCQGQLPDPLTTLLRVCKTAPRLSPITKGCTPAPSHPRNSPPPAQCCPPPGTGSPAASLACPTDAPCGP